MKMKDVFIGQLVITPKENWRHPKLPQVGKVVDIAYEYEYTTLIVSSIDHEVRVLPVVHFLGENQPREISPSNIEQYNPNN